MLRAALPGDQIEIGTNFEYEPKRMTEINKHNFVNGAPKKKEETRIRQFLPFMHNAKEMRAASFKKPILLYPIV